MTKSTIKTWDDLRKYARERAARSLKRNDPWAYAYWRETEHFADVRVSATTYPKEKWTVGAHDAAMQARRWVAAGNVTNGALWYSRAKWFVILARNNGTVMNPRKTGVNLSVFKEIAS